MTDGKGRQVTIITAGYDTIGEDGPVVTQMSESDIIVVYSDEYVERKLSSAQEKNREDFGDTAWTIGLSFLVQQALKVAEEKFADS